MQQRIGTRKSPLALLQAQAALATFKAVIPGFGGQLCEIEALGDRDQKTDLREAPDDFFTRDLDEALRRGEIDCAVHSAKDLPRPMPEDIDWFWLPHAEDPRDAWVLPAGKTFEELPATAVIGVSSDRRADYARKLFPDAALRPVRGGIQRRIEQLDAGNFDALLLAGAALNRLDLQDRITKWIPLSELQVPEGQGRLAVTFLKSSTFWVNRRKLFTKAVRFVSAGAGSADYCTVGGAKSLQDADVCLHDALIDSMLLDAYLLPTAERIPVGKRCGAHSVQQEDITQRIADFARQGKRVVRLKGGDAGIFGRLAEEVNCLDALQLAYKVYAGVSTLTSATTGTGMLLTRRAVSRGFTVMTPRAEGDEITSISAKERVKLPLILFMSIHLAADKARELLDEGWESDTPTALVFDAGSVHEQVIRQSLKQLSVIPEKVLKTTLPGIIIIGAPAETLYPQNMGALKGKRVLLTCSDAIMHKAIRRVIDFGGRPIPMPLIRLTPTPQVQEYLTKLSQYDWLVLTSASAVRCLMKQPFDVRRLPKIMTCGPGTAAELRNFNIEPDLTPEMNYSAEGLAETLKPYDFTGQKILRLRSDKAGPLLADALKKKGAEVDDVLLYKNEIIGPATPPSFDCVFFASASAFSAASKLWGHDVFQNKTIVVIGRPTAMAVRAWYRPPDITASVATVDGAIEALAAFEARSWLSSGT